MAGDVMLVIPTLVLPNQQIQSQINGQATTLNVYQLAYGLFMDVYVNSTLIIAGVICQNLNRIVRDTYLGFLGDFVWVDLEGSDDPVYTGLGTRFQLVYLTPDELPAGQG